MNKTYRLIWSNRHRAYVAASELASTRGKTGGGSVVATPKRSALDRAGRFFALGKLAGAALLTMGFALGAAAAPVLVSEQPWGSTNDQSAMNAAYGIGNWTLYNTYTTAATSVGSIFADSTNFVYLQGSAASDLSLQSFLGSHESTILDWVGNGGNLLLESAGWNTSITLGGATLNYGDGYYASTGRLTETGERLFTSVPIANASRSGNWLAHDTITADDGVSLITFIEGDTQGRGVQPIVAGYQYGKGYLLYSGLTLYQFHSTSDGSSLGDDAPSWLLNMIEGFKSPGQIADAAGGGKPADIAPGSTPVGSDLLADKVNPVFDGGTLKLDVAQGVYTQTFTIKTTGGTLDQNGNDSILTGAINDSDAGSGALTIANTGTGGSIGLAAANGYTGETTIDSGATLALIAGGSITASSRVVGNGTLDISAADQGASLQSLAGAGTVLLGDRSLTLTQAGDTFHGTIAGAGGLTVQGGAATLAGANTYTGTTDVQGGTLNLTGSLQSRAVRIAQGATLNDVSGGLASTSVVTNDGNLALGANQTLASLSGGAAGTVSLGAHTLTLANASGTYAGAITGAGALNVSGGMQTLAGNNTYAGGTRVSDAATVSVSADANLGTGALTLDGGILRTTDSFTLARAVTMGAAGGAFQTDGGTTLAVTGSLSGSGVLVKTGTGTLELAGDNAGGPAHAPGTGWTGGMVIQAGRVEVTNPWGLGWGNVVLNGGTINTTVDVMTGQAIALGGGASIDTAAGTTTTMTGLVVGGSGGDGCFFKTGHGTLNVAGNATLAQGTCVEQGTLRANGMLHSDVTVAAGGTLGGAGVINGTVDVRGTLSPGNSPGYLTVAGDVNMLAGSTYRQDIAGVAQAGPTTPVGETGYYSYLRVTDGGTFNIAADSTLAPRLENLFSSNEAGYGSAPYAPKAGDSFRILTAEGGITGRFASLAQPDGLADNTRFAVFYNTFGNQSIDLKVMPGSYAQWLAAANRNARAAAGVLDRIAAANDTGTATATQDELLYVAASQNEGSVARFVNALAGEVHGAMAAAAPQAGQRLAGAIMRQLDGSSARQPAAAGSEVARGQALWVDIGADHGRWNGSRDASSFTTNRTQVVLGADLLDGDTGRAGVGFSYTNTNVGANGGSGNIDEYMGFAYGQAALGPVVLDGMAGFGANDWHTQRGDVAGLAGTSLKTNASGQSTQVGMGLRAPLAFGNTVLEPFARMLWQKSTRGAASEGGDTPTALRLGDYSATGNRVTLGLAARSAKREPTPGTLSYQFSVGVGRDSGDLLQPTVQASLAGIGMGITSPDVGKVFGQASFHGTMWLSKQAYLYLGLNGEARRDRHDVGVSGGMRVSF